MEQSNFISNQFIGFNYPTLEGGELRFMVAPVTKNKDIVSIVMSHTQPDGTNTQSLCHVTQKTAASLFYQMNMFLDIFDNIKIDEELLADVKSETLNKFKTLDTIDIRCDCGGSLEIL